MNHLHVHLTNYLKLRRGLGFKLNSAEMLLRSFIRFAEAKRAGLSPPNLRCNGPPSHRTPNGCKAVAAWLRCGVLLNT